MLCLEDCLALCDLSEAEVLAISQHEHIPEMAAIEFGHYLVHAPDGEMHIKRIFLDDVSDAAKRGDRTRQLALKMVLRNFVLQHPRCDERHRARLCKFERRQ